MIESKVSKRVGIILGYTVMIVVLLITIYPLVWMIFGSLKEVGDFYENTWGLPTKWMWSNYVEAWTRADLGTKYMNSIFVVLAYLAINIPVVCCAAYATTRLNFKGRNQIWMFLLAGIMIPTGVLTLPVYSTLVTFGLINSRIGLALAYAGSSTAFGVFMMRTFFITLPKSLEEAACIDGCTRFGAFVRIILPLTKPGVMILIIYNGLSTWTEYQMAYLTLTRPEMQTIPVGLAQFQGNNAIQFPVLFAALSISTVPMIIVYILGQKTFISGMTAGAVKG